MNAIHFVSLGPGEADLITLKALKTLQNADIIFCPATKSIKSEAKISSRSAQILYELEISSNKIRLFFVPMNKDRTMAQNAYDELFNECCLLFKEKKNIAIVAEGDCSFYSSIHYIYDKFINSNIPVSKIAGVPAFIAAGSFAGIHIVKQEDTLSLFAGIVTLTELKTALEKRETVVIMKLSQCEPIIKELILESANKPKPEYQFHYLENIGNKDNQLYITDTNTILSKNFPYFSLMIIKSTLN